MNKADNEAGSLAIDSLLNYETVKVYLNTFSVYVRTFLRDSEFAYVRTLLITCDFYYARTISENVNTHFVYVLCFLGTLI
jgi:hypothetical protein